MCQLRTQDILTIRNVCKINYIWRSFDGGTIQLFSMHPKCLMEELYIWESPPPRVLPFRHNMDFKLKNVKLLTRYTPTCSNIVSDMCISSAHPVGCSSHYIEKQRAGRLPASHMVLISPGIVAIASFNEQAGCFNLSCQRFAGGCFRVHIWTRGK